MLKTLAEKERDIMEEFSDYWYRVRPCKVRIKFAIN